MYDTTWGGLSCVCLEFLLTPRDRTANSKCAFAHSCV